MILLDTNYLIRSLIEGTDESRKVGDWLDRGEELCTSSIVWYEFLCGPADRDGVELMREVIKDRIIPFVGDTAIESAHLFNKTGRTRRLRVDAMIAATAIMVAARLATGNTTDFSVFISEGLTLAR
jgi:predicted nucleic acid-binding protein